MIKKNIFMKVLVLMLVISTITSSSVMAKEKPKLKKNEIEFISNEAQVSKIIDGSEGTLTEESMTVDYSFEIEETNDERWPNVIMDIVIGINGKNYDFIAAGEVERLELTDNIKYLQGPLRGTVKIKGKEMDVIVGFQNVEGSEEVSLGLTIQASGESKSDIAFIRTGKKVKDETINNAIDKYKDERKEKLVENEVDEPTTKEVSTSSSFSYEGSDYAYILNNGLNTETGSGTYMRAYEDEVGNRVKTDFKTFSFRFDDSDFPSVPNGQFIDASIHEFRMGLKRTSGDSVSYIANIEEIDFGSYENKTSSLFYVFLDVLAYFNYPTWTIDAVFGDAEGKVTRGNYANHQYINVKVSAFDKVDFDTDINMTTIFQLQDSNTNYSGSSSYNSYTDLTYVIDCLSCAFYVDCEQAIESLTMNF